MKVLIATGLYPPEGGGPATYSKILEEKLPQEGHDVAVLPFRKVRRYPKIIRHIAYFFYVMRYGKNVDIIYAQDPVSVGLPAALAAKLLRKRFFLKVVGDYAWEQGSVRFGTTILLDNFHKQMSQESIFVRILFFLERFTAGFAEKVIVPSEYLKKVVTKWGIHEATIFVIPNAAPTISKSGNTAVLRGLVKFDGQIIVSVGRLVPWKGFSELIKVFVDIQKEFPNTKLFIVGDGPERKKLEEKVLEEKLTDSVVLAGNLENDITLRYIEMSDVFVLNTSYEGFSHLILEAMLMETPIVTTRVGGNTEQLTHKKSGILIPVGDQNALKEGIRMVLKDTAMGSKMAKAASAKAKEYTQERMVKELAQLF